MPSAISSATGAIASRFERANSVVRDAAIEHGGMIGRMFESGRWTVGELASWPVSAGLVGYMTAKQEFQSGNRVRKNRVGEIVGGVGFDLASNILISMLPGGLGVSLLASMAVGFGGTVPQLWKSATTAKKIARRNFHRPDLSPMYTQRAIKGREANVSRIMDTQRFIGNEAQHFARRGV